MKSKNYQKSIIKDIQNMSFEQLKNEGAFIL